MEVSQPDACMPRTDLARRDGRCQPGKTARVQGPVSVCRVRLTTSEKLVTSSIYCCLLRRPAPTAATARSTPFHPGHLDDPCPTPAPTQLPARPRAPVVGPVSLTRISLTPT